MNTQSTVVDSFGEEWSTFRYEDPRETNIAAAEYFDLVNLEQLAPGTVIADIGCGTGRWLRYVIPHVKKAYGIEPSKALEVARENLKSFTNFVPVSARAENIPLPENEVDIAMSFGVLHHIYDTEAAIRDIYRIVKPGGSFWFYLYYNFENRSKAFKLLFFASNILRNIVSKLPETPKSIACEILAVVAYLPLITLGRIVSAVFGKGLGNKVPLSYYQNKSWYIVRTDSRDRFGTPLEKRYSRDDITKLLIAAGFQDVEFSKNQPYWHGIAKK